MNSYPRQRQKSLSPLGQIIWRLPLQFSIAKLFGPSYSLRCLVFHDIADDLSQFTKGLGVTTAPGEFESIIDFVCHYYTPVRLQDYLNNRSLGRLPRRPILISFDDAYASVATTAAPILQKHNVPAIFFVTSSLIGNNELALDNLLCYVANACGTGTLCTVARQFAENQRIQFGSLENVLDKLLPTLSQVQIGKFREAIISSIGLPSAALAAEAKLYINADQLRAMASSGFEIGSHTFSHVFCRKLTPAEFVHEIDQNKSKLESIIGTKVTSFSVPYGGPADLTEELSENLRRSGHKVVFLARDRANSPGTDLYRLNRVNIHPGTNASLFEEIEILPRLRSFADLMLRRNNRGYEMR